MVFVSFDSPGRFLHWSSVSIYPYEASSTVLKDLSGYERHQLPPRGGNAYLDLCRTRRAVEIRCSANRRGLPRAHLELYTNS
jgi:hypothetical protein